MLKKKFDFHNTKFIHKGQELSLVLSFSVNELTFLSVSDHDNFFQISSIETYSFNNLHLSQIQNFVKQFVEEHNAVASLKKVIYHTESFVPIPDEIFSNKHKEELFRLTCNSNSLLNLQIDSVQLDLAQGPVHFLCSVPSQQKSIVSGFEYQFSEFYDSVVFLKCICCRKPEPSGIFVYNHLNYFDVCLLHNGKLLLFNRFHYQNAKDFCYYLVGATVQSGLSPASSTVHLGGYIFEESEIVDLIKRYFFSFEFLKPEKIQFHPELELHNYFIQLSVS